MVYHGLPWFTMVYYGTPWYTMVDHGLPWNTMVRPCGDTSRLYYGVPRYTGAAGGTALTGGVPPGHPLEPPPRMTVTVCRRIVIASHCNYT